MVNVSIFLTVSKYCFGRHDVLEGGAQAWLARCFLPPHHTQKKVHVAVLAALRSNLTICRTKELGYILKHGYHS